jgi:hypothetical protein
MNPTTVLLFFGILLCGVLVVRTRKRLTSPVFIFALLLFGFFVFLIGIRWGMAYCGAG